MTCVGRDGCWLSVSRWVQGRGDRNPRYSVLSLVNLEREVTTSSGAMYPECGMFHRRRLTRSFADKSNLPTAGDGIPSKLSSWSHGTDPPKKESGRTGALSSFE